MGKPDPTRNPIDPLKNDPFWLATCLTHQPDWSDPNLTWLARFAMSTWAYLFFLCIEKKSTNRWLKKKLKKKKQKNDE